MSFWDTVRQIAQGAVDAVDDIAPADQNTPQDQLNPWQQFLQNIQQPEQQQQQEQVQPMWQLPVAEQPYLQNQLAFDNPYNEPQETQEQSASEKKKAESSEVNTPGVDNQNRNWFEILMDSIMRAGAEEAYASELTNGTSKDLYTENQSSDNTNELKNNAEAAIQNIINSTPNSSNNADELKNNAEAAIQNIINGTPNTAIFTGSSGDKFDYHPETPENTKARNDFNEIHRLSSALNTNSNMPMSLPYYGVDFPHDNQGSMARFDVRTPNAKLATEEELERTDQINKALASTEATGPLFQSVLDKAGIITKTPEGNTNTGDGNKGDGDGDKGDGDNTQNPNISDQDFDEYWNNLTSPNRTWRENYQRLMEYEPARQYYENKYGSDIVGDLGYEYYRTLNEGLDPRNEKYGLVADLFGYGDTPYYIPRWHNAAGSIDGIDINGSPEDIVNAIVDYMWSPETVLYANQYYGNPDYQQAHSLGDLDSSYFYNMYLQSLYGDKLAPYQLGLDANDYAMYMTAGDLGNKLNQGMKFDENDMGMLNYLRGLTGDNMKLGFLDDDSDLEEHTWETGKSGLETGVSPVMLTQILNPGNNLGNPTNMLSGAMYGGEGVNSNLIDPYLSDYLANIIQESTNRQVGRKWD